jgi:hypothetical protein
MAFPFLASTLRRQSGAEAEVVLALSRKKRLSLRGLASEVTPVPLFLEDPEGRVEAAPHADGPLALLVKDRLPDVPEEVSQAEGCGAARAA